MRGIEGLSAVALAAVALAAGTPCSARATPKKYRYKYGLLPMREQTAYLESLLPGKKPGGKDRATIKPYITSTLDVNSKLGVGCSSDSSGDWYKDGSWDGSGSAVCRDLIRSKSLGLLVLPNPGKPLAGYAIFVSCAREFTGRQRWLAATLGTLGMDTGYAREQYCKMPRKGQFYRMSLEEYKRGKFRIYVRTMRRIGAKPKTSKYRVEEVGTVEAKQQR